jgi:DNA-binding NtrC family response regulator
MANVLVVDDEKIISSSLQRVLSRAGHQVTVANHGADALRILSENTFDLLFLDLLMPEIGGGDVLDFAKKRMPQAKVLMMTAYGDLSVREDLSARGAFRVLAKPFDDITQIPKLAEEALNS